jgi:hypothetical protein
MEVVNVITLEDCFDGSFIKEFHLSEVITEKFVMELGKEHSLEYFPDFPRPFFRIEKENRYQIRGVVDSDTMRVNFSRNCQEKSIFELIQLINHLKKEH